MKALFILLISATLATAAQLPPWNALQSVTIPPGNSVLLDTTSIGTVGSASIFQAVSWTHTVGAGLTDSYLVVRGVCGLGSTPVTMTCKVDGTLISSTIGPVYPDGVSSGGFAYTFGLAGVSAGAHTILIEMQASGYIDSIIGTAASYQYVNQVTPISNTATNFNYGTAITSTITSKTGDRISTVAAAGSSLSAFQATKTQGSNLSAGSGAGNAAQSDTAGSASVSLSYTVSGADNWLIMALDINHD